MRENIGIRGRGGVFWLKLQPGENDPIHFAGAFPQMTPRAIYRHRDTVRLPRPTVAADLPEMNRHWRLRGAAIEA
jgi:hypothetical protein